MSGFIKCELPEGFGTQVVEQNPDARVRVVPFLGSVASEEFTPKERFNELWAMNSSEHPTWVGR